MRLLYLIPILSILTLSACSQTNKQNINGDNTYKRIGKHPNYGFEDDKGNTIIVPGKYKFLNPIDENGMILATNKKDKQGYIDINENILIPFEYDDLGVFSCNLTFAEKDGKLGYLNLKGEIVIDFIFSEAEYFYEPGLAIVKQNSGYGLIDTLGNLKLSCIYDEIDFSRENKIAVVRKTNKWAFYFPTSEKLTNFEFDKIHESSTNIPEKGHYNTIRDVFFNNKLALVEKNNQYALINENLEVIVSYGTYDIIKPMNCYGYSIVIKNNKYGVLDKNGILKVLIQNDLISTKPARSYGNDYTTFLVERNGKYQILNNSAELEINKTFERIDKLSNNYYLAYQNDSIFLINDNGEIVANEYSGYYDFNKGFIVRKNDKMGAISYKNNIILPFEYDSVYYPRLEKHLYASKNGLFGVIDFEGKVIIPFNYEYISRAWYNESEEFDDNLIVQKSGKLGTINMNNEVIIPLIYDGISGWVEYSPDEHYVKKTGKYGMVHPNGEIMIPCEYDFIYYYEKDVILVSKNNNFGIINNKNKTIINCEYEKIIVDFDFLGFNLDEEKEDKYVVKKDGKWSYLDTKGKIIKANIPEDEISKEYEFYLRDSNHSIDEILILAK